VSTEERIRREIERLEGMLRAVERYEWLFEGRVSHVKKQLKACIETLKRI